MKTMPGTRVVHCCAMAACLLGCPRAGEGATPHAAPHAPVSTAEPAAAHAPEHADEEAHEAMPRRVRLAAEAEKDSRVRTEEVTVGRLVPTVDLAGEVVADPDQMARVAARITGRVVEVRFKEGDTVARGQVLAVVESADLARARAAVTVASARSAAAAQQAERVNGLLEQGLSGQAQLDAARAEERVQAAELLAAQQALAAYGATAEEADPAQAARLSIRAPLAGVVVQRDAIMGQACTPDTVLATVVNMQKVFFHARLFEKNLGEVRPGARADVRLNAHPGETFPGVVETVGHQVDPAARTMVARIGLKDRAGLLRLGLFGNARVVVDRPADGPEVLTIPAAAVTHIAGQPVAFVAHPDGDYELHALKLGEMAAGRVHVLEGLRAGERVVVEAVFTLKSLVLKGSFGEEE